MIQDQAGSGFQRKTVMGDRIRTALTSKPLKHLQIPEKQKNFFMERDPSQEPLVQIISGSIKMEMQRPNLYLLIQLLILTDRRQMESQGLPQPPLMELICLSKDSLKKT